MLRVLMSIEIRNSSSGIDVESFINSASSFIADKASYKFRVVGEAKIIAIFEVKHCSAITLITSEIIRNGFCNVTCTSLTNLESWQKLLGRSNLNVQHTLSGNDFLWFEVGYYHGIPRDRFDMLWSRATQSMIHQLQQGQIGIEIFKVLGEKRLHGFTCKQPSVDWEAHLWNFQAEDKIYKSAKLVTKI
ncbi:uncharacterized protein LOC143055362 isoform X2 [Mytilus galloprovincialis]|uniref:uncharacterized protein LOC143055362 isoform X2 n=1 Tax=Mytilus galloprovincialis TaxID=29158 RepID=UPI003F7B6143